MGIKAAQVIDFLIMHAHPLVRDKKHVVPGREPLEMILQINGMLILEPIHQIM